MPKKFDFWINDWNQWNSWLKENKITNLQACISSVLKNTYIDKAILGVNSIEHLKEIMEIECVDIKNFPKNLKTNSSKILNPTLW